MSLSEFHTHAQRIAQLTEGACGIDFETEGLQPRAGARAFILGFAYKDGPTLHNHSVLTIDPRVSELVQLAVSNSKIKYLSHNSKFELAFLRHQFQAEMVGDCWDTEVFARVEYMNHMRYNLQACAERLGLSKHRPMLEWLAKHKKQGLLHHNAPLELVVPYVEQDAWLELPLYEHQRRVFTEWQRNSPTKISKVIELELKTTKNLFEMEDAGIRVDVNYCHEANNYELKKSNEAKQRFQELTGTVFKDSAKCLTPIFDQHKIRYGTTDTGRASFTADVLEDAGDNEIVRAVLDYRQPLKRSSTYWENFIALHHNGVIYGNLNQARAKTGRLSASDPNTQNWPTESRGKGSDYPVRRAFLAEPDGVIASLDYKQMELRLMCDEAGDLNMVRAFQEGRDFHQETADDANVIRDLAKNGRFAKLYGAGVPRVAETLGVTMEVARRICAALDRQSPEISGYCRGLIKYAERAPFGFNFLGRRYYFDRGLAYKYPNYRIQGGCGEILRIAIDTILPMLKSEARGNTKLLLPIHDELVFRMAREDLPLIPEIKRLMIAAHVSKKHLEMDVSTSIGPNFFDLEDHVA